MNMFTILSLSLGVMIATGAMAQEEKKDPRFRSLIERGLVKGGFFKDDTIAPFADLLHKDLGNKCFVALHHFLADKPAFFSQNMTQTKILLQRLARPLNRYLNPEKMRSLLPLSLNQRFGFPMNNIFITILI
ncbi:MAG: hypothetical protein R3A11_06770 [Bdellovibrionota bacterium]